MPTSSMEGKDWLLPRIRAELPGTVLDIGAGEGTYARLLQPLDPETTLIGVEVFAPYVEQYGLLERYHGMIVGDALTCALPEADVIILGDVLEHQDLPNAVRLWRKARQLARKAVFASIPLGRHPQGAVNGNEHERHRTTWSDAKVHLLLPGIVASWTGVEIGTYAATPLGGPEKKEK